jgi:outer membrane lipoprotein SlyB
MKANIIFIFVTTLVLGGCATQTMTGGAYTASQARQAQVIKKGTVASVKAIQISGGASGIGGAGGAALGGIAGANRGRLGSNQQAASMVAGALIGGIAGHLADNAVNTVEGQEITVQLPNGTEIAVAQEIDKKEGAFSVGEQVRILTSPTGLTRITR